MSGQLIELIIFAGIAFFVINKLIGALGSTSDDDPTKKASFFGEGVGIKDVTPKGQKSNVVKPQFARKVKVNLKGMIVTENEAEIKSGLADVMSKVPSFNLSNFIKGSKAAFEMIIKAGLEGNDEELEELVDKRYLEHFESMAASYGKYTAKSTALTAHVSEIYMFGNNIFVKILFAGKNITEKVKEMHEEWTFTKSSISAGSEWHLTNIDRPQ